MPIGVEEILRRAVAPGDRKLVDCAVDLAVPRTQPIERRPGDIVEGAEHAGDIDQRGGLLAPLRKVALRLAFEVDDHDVVLRDEHLAEMEVAVDARLGARCSLSALCLNTCDKRYPLGKERLGLFADVVGKRGQRMLERVERALRLFPRPLDPP